MYQETTLPIRKSPNQPHPQAPTTMSTQQQHKPSTAEAVAATADLSDALASPTAEKQHPELQQAPPQTEWKPSLGRRQSYAKEEHKRSMQMSALGGDNNSGGQGFTEKSQ
ncbi:hypothetical protein MCOR27_007549 [Pyricularia oryzae]|uniref:Uncharacterized protein n=5 Tax=Pyricularia TaxID=48558 RepID=A0ABQ8NM31_PYRGI|nr:uncharacterized protein MGG_10524 [Pyricularia oryzae 70-15]KAH8841757.1 hypothetical protein MCOR01_005714 [Pyricularia oryzae]KAI6299122.1 hypothetical protein MCOR33_004887 [Pyricularia grisea]EHA57523.1 hypothetical protein MGG_10524 [Pyricularia oryzae 70-15]KAH9434927.1 hypothetical protein MCOR02_003893 [Pyricularia oryzae]KAI6260983.1 hypothetical protein MCOR19_002746 [Pyricularia oryzae]